MPIKKKWKRLYYNPELTKRARKLRKNSTFGEILFWNQVKAKKILGYQFCRQKPIGNYIVDFYCNPLDLVVEIDGPIHDKYHKYDQKRQMYLESLGQTVLRFKDLDVRTKIDDIIQTLSDWIINYEQTHRDLFPPF